MNLLLLRIMEYTEQLKTDRIAAKINKKISSLGTVKLNTNAPSLGRQKSYV